MTAVQSEASAKSKAVPALIAFEAQLGELCSQDKYREMAESYLAFVKTHGGTHYLAFEPIPAKIGDHLVAKTKSPSAFVTLTLRRPTWIDELEKKLNDPAAFQTYVKSLETEVLDIAKQSKKIH